MKTPAPNHHAVLRVVTESAAAGSIDAGSIDGAEPDHERARSEARALWATLARARSTGVPGVIVAAEDAVFRFYLPLAHALAAGSGRWSADPMGGDHAAELGLAQAVLSWHGSEAGFLRVASRAVTDRLHRLSNAAVVQRGPREPIPSGKWTRRMPVRW